MLTENLFRNISVKRLTQLWQGAIPFSVASYPYCIMHGEAKRTFFPRFWKEVRDEVERTTSGQSVLLGCVVSCATHSSLGRYWKVTIRSPCFASM